MSKKETRLIICDVDATLIMEEGIDLLASFADKEKEVSEITKRAMNGEISFNEALKKRVSFLEGLPSSVFLSALGAMHFSQGADTFFDTLKESNQYEWKIGLASGGFASTVKILAKAINADFYIANSLEIKDDILTGKLEEGATIVDKDAKKNFLISKAKELNVPLERTVAIGDGANDLEMLKTAGRALCLNPKPFLRNYALENEYPKKGKFSIISEFADIDLQDL